MKAIYHTFTNVFQNNKILDFSGILILVILITLPLGSFAVNSISVILFFINAIAYVALKRKRIIFPKVSILIIGIYILGILSLLWSDNFKNTLEGLIRFLSYLVLPLAFSFCFNNKKNQKEKIINFFSKSLCLYAFYCLFLGIYNSIVSTDISYLFYHVGFPKNRTVLNSNLLTLNSNCQNEKQQI